MFEKYRSIQENVIVFINNRLTITITNKEDLDINFLMQSIISRFPMQVAFPDCSIESIYEYLEWTIRAMWFARANEFIQV